MKKLFQVVPGGGPAPAQRFRATKRVRVKVMRCASCGADREAHRPCPFGCSQQPAKADESMHVAEDE